MGTRRYPEEFRREVVQLFRRSNRPRIEIARSLGIPDGSLAVLVNEFEARDAGGLDEDERSELIRLRKRVVEVEEE